MSTRRISGVVPVEPNRQFLVLVVLLLVLSTLARSQVLGGITPIHTISITDVSPDAAFGQAQVVGNVDPSGRTIALVIDPTNPNILYAVSDLAGVWKSTDAAHTWKHASNGLRLGAAIGQPLSLAIDAANPQRLLYMTAPNDGRLSPQDTGLWMSFDAAASWQHVDLGCEPFIYLASLLFASGRPFVTTNCGIYTSTDPKPLGSASWTRLDQLPFLEAGAILAGPGPTLFACQDDQVFRSTNLGAVGSWSTGPTLPGPCYGIAVAPLPELVPSTIVVVHKQAMTQDVSVVDFNAGSLQSLSLSSAAGCCGSGSGASGVWTVLRKSEAGNLDETRPGHRYDVYAADNKNFFVYTPAPSGNPQWEQLRGLHVDPWAMAFPDGYDPFNVSNGNCSGYAANDGGVFFNDSSIRLPGDPTSCDRLRGWVRAESGLHTMMGTWMAGLSQPQSACPDPSQPCPVLYLPSADNDVFVTMRGGIPGSSWLELQAGLGDGAQVFVDPVLPGQVLATRNENYHLLKSGSNAPPGPGASIVSLDPPDVCFGPCSETNPPFIFPITGIVPPGLAGLSQVMTLPAEARAELGDYVGLQVTPTADLVIRNLSADASQWFDISPHDHFGPGQLGGDAGFWGAVATAGGHTNLTVYVLTGQDDSKFPVTSSVGPGQVWKLGPNKAAWVPAYGTQNSPSGIHRAHDLFVNPYDPNELYVTDMGDNSIKSSRNGGMTWTVERTLMNLATNYGEFIFNCGAAAKSGGPGRYSVMSNGCALSNMAFHRDHPEIRIAAIAPATGLAFSRDSGRHWLPLDIVNPGVIFDQPTFHQARSTFYDPQPNPRTNAPSIYVSLSNAGVIRVDGPFPTLEAIDVHVCPLCAGHEVFPGHNIVAINDATDVVIPLQRGGDEIYHGVDLVDSAVVSDLSYHINLDGQPILQFDHVVTDQERSTGVATLSNVPGVDLGMGVGRPGGMACVPATLTAAGTQVAATTNDIGFDSSLFTFNSVAINPAIAAGTPADKQLSSSAVGPGAERVEILGNTNAIPDGLLHTSTFTIGLGVGANIYPLSNTPVASNPGGTGLPGVTGEPGQICVTTCSCDCNCDGTVTIGEVIKGINLFLGHPLCDPTNFALSCPVADTSLNGTMSIGEVVQCVNRFLNGCA